MYQSLLNSCLFFSCHLLEIMKRAPPTVSSQAWQHGIIWAGGCWLGGSWWGGDSTHLEGIAGALFEIWLILTLHHQHVLGCSSTALPLFSSHLPWHLAFLLLSLLSWQTPLHQDMKWGTYTILLHIPKWNWGYSFLPQMGAFSKYLNDVFEHSKRKTMPCRNVASFTIVCALLNL